MAETIWHRVTEEPLDRQLCNIKGSGNVILCSLPYLSDAQGWFDLFATPEAGAAYLRTNGDVIAWMPAELIPDVPDDFDRNSG